MKCDKCLGRNKENRSHRVFSGGHSTIKLGEPIKTVKAEGQRFVCEKCRELKDFVRIIRDDKGKKKISLSNAIRNARGGDAPSHGRYFS